MDMSVSTMTPMLSPAPARPQGLDRGESEQIPGGLDKGSQKAARESSFRMKSGHFQQFAGVGDRCPERDRRTEIWIDAFGAERSSRALHADQDKPA
jgi:hypothetical protein